MRITLDDVVTEEQPTAVTWNTPRPLGNDGEGAPIYGPYHSCTLAFERLTTANFQQWWRASADGERHDVRLPHPATGVLTEYTCYVNRFTPRMNTRGDCDGYANGADIRLTRIEVTL